MSRQVDYSLSQVMIFNTFEQFIIKVYIPVEEI